MQRGATPEKKKMPLIIMRSPSDYSDILVQFNLIQEGYYAPENWIQVDAALKTFFL